MKVVYVIVAVVVLGLIAWFVWGNNSSAPTPAPTPVPQATAPMPTPTPTPAPAAPTPVTPAPQPSATAPTPVKVSISNFSFVPANITVKKGTTVTWTNNDSVPHTVTGDNGGPASQTLSPGQSYSYTFTVAGSFPYHCSIHPYMKGTVTVTS